MVGNLDRLFSGPNPGRGCSTWIKEIQGSVGRIASLQRFPNRFSGGLVGLGRETAVFYRRKSIWCIDDFPYGFGETGSRHPIQYNCGNGHLSLERFSPAFRIYQSGKQFDFPFRHFDLPAARHGPQTVPACLDGIALDVWSGGACFWMRFFLFRSLQHFWNRRPCMFHCLWSSGGRRCHKQEEKQQSCAIDRKEKARMRFA